MKKIFFSFITYFSCLTILANDSLILPKPIKLEFFELSNKLTAKHKKLLDVVIKVLKEKSNVSFLITYGGAKSKRFDQVGRLRVENAIRYLENSKLPNDWKDGIDLNLDIHTVEINFVFKGNNLLENIENLSEDNNIKFIMDFAEGSFNLTDKLKSTLDSMLLFCTKEIFFKISVRFNFNLGKTLGSIYYNRYQIIVAYLIKKRGQIIPINKFEFNEETDLNIIEVVVFKKEK